MIVFIICRIFLTIYIKSHISNSINQYLISISFNILFKNKMNSISLRLNLFKLLFILKWYIIASNSRRLNASMSIYNCQSKLKCIKNEILLKFFCNNLYDFNFSIEYLFITIFCELILRMIFLLNDNWRKNKILRRYN